MQQELHVLKVVTERLEAAGFSYMVSGSMAMNFYAQPRMTRDVDIVIELVHDDAVMVARLFDGDFYCDIDDIREAVKRHSLFNIIHFEKAVKIDFIIRKETLFRREEFSRRQLMSIEGISLWVVSPEDLLLSKLFWGKDSHSEFQLRDVRNLITFGPSLDWLYIEKWSKEIGVDTLLKEVRP